MNKTKSQIFSQCFSLSALLLSMACIKVTDKPKEKSQFEGYQEEFVVDGLLENPHPESSDPWRLGARRLELKKGAQLISHGAPVEIEVQELVADEATLETFSEEAQKKNPRTGEEGRSSGALQLRVLGSATGSLKIISRGEAGGSGNPGLSAQELGLGVPPMAGTGQDAVAEQEIEGRFSSKLINIPRGSAFRMTVTCLSHGTDGGTGAKGFPGGRGGPGFRGGDTGHVEVQLPETSTLTIEIIRTAGAGGEGGLGGQGGAGGPGGPGGKEARYNGRQICHGGQQGPTGATGDRGPQGETGAPGSVEAACLQKGSRSYCMDKLPAF